MMYVSWIVKTIVILCMMWLLAFSLLGGGQWGKDLFASWAKKSCFRDKAGVPIIMLTIPILIAGSIASMFATSTTTTNFNRYQIDYIYSFRRRLLQPDQQQSVLLVLVIFLPCFVYVVSCMNRKLSIGMSIDKALMKSGNTFGMLAVIVFSWLLIPVSRRGPIGKLFAWDSIKIVNYHMWSGRIIIVSGLIHGLEHTIRLALQGRDVLISYFFPPIQCWRRFQTYKPVICEKAKSSDDGGGCSCYDHFLPLTGLVATLGLVFIGLSSLYNVRRNNFAAFATLHYISTPLTFVAICIHYNKSILYASGSLLYYIASNFPNWIEYIVKRCPWNRSNVKVVAVEKLNSDSKQRPCIALTIEATEDTVQRCCQGDYVYLLVPSISQVSHPFTVNRVLGQKQRLRIIFRVTGSFTRALETAIFFESTKTTKLSYNDNNEKDVVLEEVENDDLLSEDLQSSVPVPRLFFYFDGYYGSRRLTGRILRHDVCVLVAAGIGITPYLSLFSNHDTGALDGLIQENYLSTTPKSVILHWICRDRSLIEYCRKEYNLDSLSSNGNNQNSIRECHNYSINIIIHKTGVRESPTSESTTPSAMNEKITRTNPNCDEGAPFELTKFSIGDSICNNVRYFVIFSLSSWGGLLVLWRFFLRQRKEEYIGRLITLVVLTLYGMMIAILVNIFWNLYTRRNCRNAWPPVTFNSQGKDNSVYDIMGSNTVVELSNTNYKDENIAENVSPFDNPFSSIVPDVQLPKVKFKILQGRPSLKEILEDLQHGISPALFCCVPSGSLGKDLNEGVSRTSRPDKLNIPVYQESFIL